MRAAARQFAAFLLLPVVLLGYGCDAGLPAARLAGVAPGMDVPAGAIAPAVTATAPGASDLADLRVSRRLRILAPQGANGLDLSPVERRLVEEYAASEGLTPIWRGAPAGRLIRLLKTGAADLVAGAGMARDGTADVQRTLQWGVSREQIVARVDTGVIRSENDLYTRQIAVKPSSPAWEGLERAARLHPAMQIVEIPEEMDMHAVLEQVSSGRYDLAVGESLALNSELPNFLRLHVAYEFDGAEPLTWAVRGGADELLASLNQFLNKSHLELGPSRIYREDLAGLQARRMLRLVTYRSPANCYFDRGRFKGFEYELVRRFAEQNKMRLEVVIADSHEDMRRLLLEGKGDLIAASLPTQAYMRDSQLAYTRPYNHAAPVIVGREQDAPLIDVRDLDGHRVVVPPESPYLDALLQLQQQGIRVQVLEAGPGVDTETALFRVARGFDDLTIIGSHQIPGEFGRQLNLQAQFALSEPAPLSWAVRKSDTKLLYALNEFLGAEYRKGFYNTLYARYLDHPGALHGNPGLLAQSMDLSPYDAIVRKYADRYGFDWRLIVAQMFQESHFQPDALSDAGAQGLMQVLPETAELLGITDLNDPTEGIAAGVRYLDYLRNQFEPGLLLEDRTWFTLAAYNAGYNRVQRARRLAEQMNLDKDRWFDNVELAMLKLAAPYEKDGDRVQDCRCGQTVVYVRDIRTRYNSYVRFSRAAQAATAAPPAESDI